MHDTIEEAYIHVILDVRPRHGPILYDEITETDVNEYTPGGLRRYRNWSGRLEIIGEDH